ncbi:MAG TPA: response regulator transcription factor [Bdellovibrionales bacterium]|nr:response regulator transcription factor [Bdellovibrionales bacterium]
MFRILLVEDSPEAQKLVTSCLGQAYDLVAASTCAEATSLIRNGQYDLILLDVMLPDGDGYQLCSLIQNNESTRDIPIIFLTAKDSLPNKVMGFSLGADDYIVKPFDPLELRARVEAKLRRISRKKEASEIIQKGDIQVNIPFQRAYLLENGQKRDLGLTPIEFRLLLYFVQRLDQVLTREQLLLAVWGDDIHVSDRSIDTHVSKLRKKLSPKSDYIQSIYGTGYVFSINTQSNARAESSLSL